MAKLKRFDNPRAIEEWIKGEHKRRHGNAPLAHGVGNDMSYALVRWAAPWTAHYYPEGIDGELILCEVG